MDLKQYIPLIWPYNVDEVYLDGATPFSEKTVDNLVSELFAHNLDGEKNIAGVAAMALQKLRKIPGSKIDLIEKISGKTVIGKVFYNLCSEDYSKNVLFEDYIKIFNEPSLKEVIFQQQKNSGRQFEFKDHWGDRNYRLSRQGSNILFEIRTPKDTEDIFDVNSRIGIKFEKENLIKYEPSDKINEYFKQIDSEFPYPLKKETRWHSAKDKKVGSAVTRYLPNLEWFELNLREGEFHGEHWSAILSGLRDSGFIENDLKYFEGNKHILRKTYEFSAPFGKFDLRVQRKRIRETPDIILSYDDKYTLPKLEIIMARIYKYGDINPYLF